MSFFIEKLKKNGHLEQIHLGICYMGSRDENLGAKEWGLFAPNLTIYGFDADKAACDLLNSSLEARNINWKEKHIPLAVWDSSGTQKLYVSKNVYGSSLYPPKLSIMDRFGSYYEQTGLFEFTTTEGSLTTSAIEDIETIRLDDFFESRASEEIDIMIMDVQGAELNILEGASHLIQRGVLAVVAETMFIELYENQPLFGDIDVYLRRQHDFTLFDFTHVTRGKRRGIPFLSQEHPGQLFFAYDAFWFRDLIEPSKNRHLRTPDRLLKLACIADILNFPDYALEVLVELTYRHGEEAKYNCTRSIVEGLKTIPWVEQQGIEVIPIVARIKHYL
jgi:FkbM family methyltransferase